MAVNWSVDRRSHAADLAAAPASCGAPLVEVSVRDPL